MRVDVIDRLPTPYGLVRYGVAPDHKSIKSIAQYLRKVLESPGVRFLGGVHLGEDVTRDELVAAYDAVIYATGAMRDRRLGIPGEDLPGSYAATDFVNWYCGHPDVDAGAFTLDAESVAVIGVGNVAVDVARILARDPAELHATDVPQPVLDALYASKVREVHMIGRRGPAFAKFTTKELRELGELPGVEIVVHADEADLTAFDASGESARPGRGRPACPREPGRHHPVGAGPGRPSPLPPGTHGGWSSGSGCGPWRSSGPNGSVVSPWSGRRSTPTGRSAAPGSSRRSTRRWCCVRSATRASRCRACRSIPGPPSCRTTAAASSAPTAPRCPGSTWPAGSSAARPA